MSSYRFCRTDDVALLVAAYNRCYRVHFAGLPELTVEDFKRDIRGIDLWCSSCMVATAEGEPIAVLLAGKRDDGNLIHRIGVHPGHQRRGHGRHLLSSLGAKLAILGPPGIEAEVPEDLETCCAFFEACGFRRDREYTDWELPPSTEPPSAAAAAAVAVSFDDLEAAGALDPAADRSWARRHRSLRAAGDGLVGLAIATDRIEGFLLHHGTPGRDIAALGVADPERGAALLGLLVARLRAEAEGPVRLERAWPGEVPEDWLRSWGFRPARRYVRFVTRATAA